jgi:hypothetical protein
LSSSGIAYGQHARGFVKVLNSPISYQPSYDIESQSFRNNIDLNISLFIINMGYDYNEHYGSTMYFGLGFTVVQLQYGRNFQDKYNLIRIRSDLSPLFFEKVETTSAWRYLSFGAFCDYAFNNPDRKLTFGLTIGINLGAFAY